MAFLKAVQHIHKEAFAEFQLASKVFSNACKVYTPYRLAAAHALSTDKSIVEEVRARRVYKIACREYHLARAKFVGIVREEAISSGEIRVSDVEISETMIQANQAKILGHAKEQAFAQSVKQIDIYTTRAVIESQRANTSESLIDIEHNARKRYKIATEINNGVEPEWERVDDLLSSPTSTFKAVVKEDFTLNMSETI